MLPSSACVVPLAPAFEDPPASPNFAPTIVDSDPRAGSIIQPGLTLYVDLTDLNVRDSLYVRWVSDYPLATADSRVLTDAKMFAPSPNGAARVVRASYRTDCAALTPGLNVHRIQVIAADRPLKKPDDPSIGSANLRFEIVDAPDDSTHVVTATWLLVGCS